MSLLSLSFIFANFLSILSLLSWHTTPISFRIPHILGSSMPLSLSSSLLNLLLQFTILLLVIELERLGVIDLGYILTSFPMSFFFLISILLDSPFLINLLVLKITVATGITTGNGEQKNNLI